MIPIKLGFEIDLCDYNYEGVNKYNGLTFHRFLPNNKLDKFEKSYTPLMEYFPFGLKGEVKKKTDLSNIITVIEV